MQYLDWSGPESSTRKPDGLLVDSFAHRAFSPGLYEVTVPITAEPPRVEVCPSPALFSSAALLCCANPACPWTEYKPVLLNEDASLPSADEIVPLLDYMLLYLAL